MWLIDAQSGATQPVTDFGDRSVVIARRTAWAADSRSLYTAIAEIDADVVLFRNLLP